MILSTGSTLQVPVRELKRGPLGASMVTLEAAEREAIQRAMHYAGGFTLASGAGNLACSRLSGGFGSGARRPAKSRLQA